MTPKKLTFNKDFLLFLAVILLELSLLVYLIAGKRMVLGHDGFEALALQWYFVNSKVMYNQIPLWTPYLTHGNPTWWFFIYSRMDIFSNLLMLFSGWIKNLNFLPLFYSGIFFNKLILLTGTWFLAKRYFKNSLTSFFVCSMMMASTIVMTQTSFSLVLFYLLPLTLELLHRFLDTGRWMWLFLAEYLFCTVSVHMYYFVPIFTLAVFVYFLIYYFEKPHQMFKRIEFHRTDFLWIFLILAVLGIFSQTLIFFKDPLLYIHDLGRQGNGQVSLDNFLIFGGGTGLAKWLEMGFRISPNLDYTLYMGALSLPLALIGVFSRGNAYKSLIFISAAFFCSFSSYRSVSTVVYMFWPLMKYYKHLGFIAPLIKFYLCFLSGFGFEEVFDVKKDSHFKPVFFKSLLAAAILGAWCVILHDLSANNHILSLVRLYALGTCTVPVCYFPSFYIPAIHQMMFICLIGSVLFFLWPFIRFTPWAACFLGVVIIFSLTDVYTYAFEQIKIRSFALTDQLYSLTAFKPIPYLNRRSLQAGHNKGEELVSMLKGSSLDAFNNITFSDLVDPIRRSDSSLLGVHELFDAFDSRKNTPAFLKLVGANEDKIQFFSKAYPVDSDKELKGLLKEGNDKGDILFYEPAGASASMVKSAVDLSGDDRIKLSYDVMYFSPNELHLTVNAPKRGQIWLEYADGWYPFWKAQVDGRPEQVFKSNLAYKAILLKPGVNTVRFYIENKILNFMYHFFMWSGLVWTLMLFYFLGEIVLKWE